MTLATLAFTSFPVMVGMAVVVHSLVLVLLTDRIHLDVLKVRGRSDLFFRLKVIKKLMTIANIAVMLPFGLLSIIAGQSGLSLLTYLLNSYYTRAVLSYTLRDQFRDLLPYFTAAAVMVAFLYGCNLLPLSNEMVRLACQIFLGFITYGALCHRLRTTPFTAAWGYMRPRLVWDRTPRASANPRCD